MGNNKVGFTEAATPTKYYSTCEITEDGTVVQLNKAVIVTSTGAEVSMATEATLVAIKNATLNGGKLDGQTVTSLEQLIKTLIAEQRITNYLLQNEFTSNNEDELDTMRIEILSDLNK